MNLIKENTAVESYFCTFLIIEFPFSLHNSSTAETKLAKCERNTWNLIIVKAYSLFNK